VLNPLKMLISTPVSRLLSIGHAQPVEGQAAVVGQFVWCVFWSAPVMSCQVQAPPG
jgi:hypothetical protein